MSSTSKTHSILKKIKRLFMGFALAYAITCFVIYLFQEKLIFFPEKLAHSYQFKFDRPFDEYQIPMHDGVLLNLLHFKADSCRGAVLHFHGNAGSNRTWGERAELFTSIGYDFFVYDYRGFGKSEGKISQEDQLIADAETVYQFVESKITAAKISIEGFSIGSGIAVQIAAKHPIHQLILLAPYQSLTALMGHKFPFLPSFLLKYPLASEDYFEQISAPITLFHGTADETIPLENSTELSKHFKAGDRLIVVEEMTHNGLPYSRTYLDYLARF